MKSIKVKLAILAAFTNLIIPSMAIAQVDHHLAPRTSPHDGDSIRRLELEVRRLNRDMQDLRHRVSYLEQGERPFPPDRPREVLHACMIVDTGYTKTFLGTGATRIDAEFSATQRCSSAINSSYCSTSAANMKCDTNLESRGRGYVCVVTDSGYNRSFRGEGETAVAAEAQAKISCQSSVNAVYCGKARARCEEI